MIQLRASVTSKDQRAFIKISVLLNTAPKVVATQLAEAVPQGHLQESGIQLVWGF